MATTFEQLLIELRLQGATPTKRQLQDIRREVQEVGNAFNFLATGASLTYLAANISQIVQAFGHISGINVAAQFQSVAFALESVTRNSASALKIWRELKDLGGSIGVDPAMLGQQASQMIGLGVPQNAVVPELKKLTDALAYARVGAVDMQSVMFNLLQIRAMGGAKASFADIRQMLTRAPGMGTLLSQGLGIEPGDLMKTLRGESMSGSQVYDALMKGVDAIAQGAAAARALHDPLFAVASLFLTLRQAMESTGDILIKIGMPLVLLSRQMVSLFKATNEWSGGLLGLSILMGGALWLATRTATAALWDFVKSMVAVAGTSRLAALASGGGSAAGGVLAGGIAGIIGRVVSVIPAIIKGGIIGTIISGAGNWIADKMQQSPGNEYGANKLRALATGAGVGALIGSIIPGLGTAAGAALGGAIGLIGSFFSEMFGGGKKDKAGENEKTLAANTKRAADSLDEIKGHFRTWGGGPRTQSAVSSFQLEWQLSKVLGI